MHVYIYPHVSRDLVCMLMGFPATPLPPATVAMVAVGGDRYCISRLRSCVLEILVPDVVSLIPFSGY